MNDDWQCCRRGSSLDATYLDPDAWNRILPKQAPTTTLEPYELHRVMQTASRPMLCTCSDDADYYIKGGENGRRLASDYIVARLGRLLDAPVPEVALVNVSQDFVDANHAQISHVRPGLGNASPLLKNCRDTFNVVETHRRANNRRYAALAVLFGWAVATDHQFLIDNNTNLVWAVDFSHFFPKQGNWNIEDLDHFSVGPCEPDRYISNACAISEESWREMCRALAHVTAQQIADIVGSVPNFWGLSRRDKANLAWFLGRRRDRMLVSLCSLGRQPWAT